MNEYLGLAIVCIIVFIFNMPFGYWRQGVKKFSLQWALAIHVPIPMIIALRYGFHLGFQLYTYPFMVAAFFSGQWLGAKIRKNKQKTKDL
ncbi:MAG: hypothetical protein AUJ98_04245 [Bacteroidetes bacterium CG2_30_33_31]|nr:MAG: hypothetical protein AUJ98_04245 [Bacteroidetes bacterium CG2_30_33_31]